MSNENVDRVEIKRGWPVRNLKGGLYKNAIGYLTGRAEMDEETGEVKYEVLFMRWQYRMLPKKDFVFFEEGRDFTFTKKADA